MIYIYLLHLITYIYLQYNHIVRIFAKTNNVHKNEFNDLFVSSVSDFQLKLGLIKSNIPAISILLMIISIAVISPNTG